jgi:osmotically inducible protein OsmC
MPARRAHAVWSGSLKEGSGDFRVGSGQVAGAYTFATRFEEAPGTNPEELIGAAHASCFSMFLAATLGKAGFAPRSISTEAVVHLGTVDGAPTITKIELHCVGDVPGIDAQAFAEQAAGAKKGCPVSKALASVAEIALDARLA